MKLQLLIVFSFSLICLLIMPCYAVGTRAGFEITTEAEAYTGTTTIEVPVVSVIVDQTYGLGLDAPVTSGSLIAGSTFYSSHDLTNVGNGSDLIHLSLAGTTSEFSSTLIKDDNNDGLHEAGETTPVPTDILLAEDASYRFFVALTSPSDASTGLKGYTSFNGESSVIDGGPYIGANANTYGGPDSVISLVELTVSEPLDKTSPTISDILINKKIRFPKDIISGMFEFEATIQDDRSDNIGLIILRIYSYETGDVVRKIEWQAGQPEPEGVHYDASTGKFSYSAPTPLPADTYTLELEVQDKSGNSIKESISPLYIYPTDKVYTIGPVVNHPNPFKPLNGEITKIAYTLSTDATVTIYLYNIKGSVIWKRTYTEFFEGGSAGYNEIPFNGRSDFGEVLGNAIYLYHIVHKGKIIGKGKLTVFDAR